MDHPVGLAEIHELLHAEQEDLVEKLVAHGFRDFQILVDHLSHFAWTNFTVL